MQIRRSPEVHDVVIIGSGASGGMAAWNLTRKGINVLMLDAGVKFDRATFWSHVKPWEAEDKLARGQRPQMVFQDATDSLLPGKAAATASPSISARCNSSPSVSQRGMNEWPAPVTLTHSAPATRVRRSSVLRGVSMADGRAETLPDQFRHTIVACSLRRGSP